MNSKINFQLIETTTFDSGALGMMAMVLHQFKEAGIYRVGIYEQEQAIAEVDFSVDENSTVMQLDIDLAQEAARSKGRAGSCECPDKSQETRVISPMGYVLFYASSSGRGYSAKVATSNGELVFESTSLQAGDLFAISLLEPVTYSMKNTLGTATGELTVTLPEDLSRRINTLETMYVDVTEKNFKPESVDLISSQGLVFRINGQARILVERKGPRLDDRRKPKLRWRKLVAEKQGKRGA